LLRRADRDGRNPGRPDGSCSQIKRAGYRLGTDQFSGSPARNRPGGAGSFDTERRPAYAGDVSVCPGESEVLHIAGGRETCLRSLQPLSLYAANSMFTNGDLTTGGQNFEADKRMIEDAGFEIGHLVNA